MNLKQTLLVNYYTEGDTKGNCERSMLKAGYKSQYARGHCGTFIVANSCVKKAIEDKIKAIQIAWEDRISKVITRLETEINETKSPSTLCLLVNAQKGYMDMQAKNEGKYALDNAQRTEEAKLTEVQKAEVKRYTKWRMEQDLEEQKLGSEILQEATEGHRKDDNGI